LSTKGFQKILQHCDPFAVGCNNLQGKRKRRKTAFSEREDEDERYCCRAHEKCVKVTGKGDSVSDKSVCV
jgi:hypothetical protein